ncbi:secretory phospholipase A2 receptor-like [Lytechinus variegatus]|uniref:secretory phospholipase A2 receptor-like n=1 Tax=Lytechinus variegatus TaxID=7654 RepID=UPI001BB2CC4F|nr:secretory phospholipase A2 receptor-like [Lytechinus variegatus]
MDRLTCVMLLISTRHVRRLLQSLNEFGKICLSDNLSFGGSCYHFVQTKSNFSSAKSTCESVHGWHLVYIGSQEEQDFLERELPHMAEGYWIGLSSVTWLDGSSLTYNNFGGPYVSTFNNEGIAFRISKGSRAWYDASYNGNFRFICENEGAVCVGDDIGHNDSCYHFSAVNSRFPESRSTCEGFGMHLVYVGSQEEQDFLVSHLVDTEEYWIGLSSMVWLDGSHLVYNNIPYHDFAFDDEGICFRMYPSDLVWYDQNCSDSYHYICEKEIDNQEPTSTVQPSSHQARSRSSFIKLLAVNLSLTGSHVIASHSVHSVTRCANLCLDVETCSCFSFIEHEMACLLGEICEVEDDLNFYTQQGAITYSQLQP